MEEPESFSIDSEDVREQIEQQRALAAQLREKLEHDELQLASKEQQNELLKSKLSLLKSRTKSKRNASSTEKDDKKNKNIKDQSGSSPKQSDSKYTPRKQPGNSVNKGKINILREQLEQNRLRFERHGLELSEDTRSMEAMVEQLRHELEERDVTIQQLQEGQETPVLSSYVEQNLEPMDVSTQLLQKEEEVRNLTNQVSDLHNTILELQENLKEKDCVIEARTQAISLLSEDMSKKWRANVDMLEETRQQMQIMQENFIRIEAGLNAEIEQLSLQLQNNAEKLSHVESNLRVAEAARNDLASHNAELLTELDVLKAAPKASQGLEEAKLKVDELTQAVSEANKLTVKLKAEHKAKVKALNKQIDSLRKESDLSGELVHLQNHIAELEEEKGNLQLHLIEIEDSTATQEQKVGQLLETVTELQNQKIVSEMKLVELEEQLSLKGVIEQELSELKLKLEDRENEIQSLKESIGNAQISSCPDQLSDLEKELAEARISLKEWQCRYEDLENQLAEKVIEARAENVVCGEQTVGQNFISDKQKEDLEEKVRYLEESMLEKRIQVQELETLIQNSLEKIEIISSQGDCTNCLTFKQQLLDQDTQIKSLETSIDALKEENETLRVEINHAGNLTNVEAPIAMQSSKPPSPVNILEDITDLKRQLIEASGELELKREECARLEGKLKAQIEKSKKIAVNLKVKTLANKDLEERISKYETLVQSNKTEVEGLMKEKEDLIEKWQMETSEKDAALSQTAENLALRELDIQNLSQQLVDKSSAVDELQAALASLQARASELQLIVEEKSAAIERLNIDNAEYHQRVEREKLAELQGEVVTLRNQLLSESEEKQAAISKLENFTKQAKLKLAKEKKVRSELLEKQNELEALLTEKNSALAIVQEQHAIALRSAQLEKEGVEVSLGEQQEQISLLRQQLEQERSKLQYASENVNAEEAVEMTEELQVIPSVESFQTEIDNLCLSFNGSSPQDVLPILEDEKTKTMSELRTSFESLHCQIIERLQNRPDVHGDRKLFAELRNLITRVMNRTAALESKIKQIVAESDSILHNKLHEAERSIQSLEISLSEAKNYIEVKDKEKVNLEETVNKIDQERWTLCQQIQEKTENYFDLEVKLKEMNDETSTLLQTKSSLQEQLQEKETFVQNLQSKLQSSVLHSEQLQQEINNLHQHNNDLRIDLERAHEECEALKLKYLTAEKDINTANVSAAELKVAYEDAVKKGESLQQQVDESTQYYSEMQNQLQNSSQEIAELQQQLERTTQTTSQLKEEVSAVSNMHSQQSASWVNEKEQFEKRISDLTQELQGAFAQVSKEATQLSPQMANGEVEEQLRQQLAEKTAELENYQRRLIQLQMGAPDVPDVPLFNFSSNENQVSQAFQEQEKVAIQQEVYQVNTSNSDSLLDAFKPAASFFEKTPEVDNLHIKIQSLTEQLNALLSEKDSLEVEKCHLRANLETLREELNISQADLEATQPTIEDLKLKVSELTAALQATEVCFEEERNSASKLQGKIEALQWKLENEKYEKETAENELKVQAQKQAEERPDIPQSLDTHVFSLQDSGSGFNRTEKQDSFDGQKADETLMESNMTLLESELRGMVMSHLDGNLKQDAESGGKENTDTLFSHVRELKIKLTQLETEKKNALSEIDVLRAQIQALSQSSTEIVSSTSQTESGVNDSLMNEDDSWGWGAEGAHLEMQHQQQKSQSVTVSDDFVKELQEQIDSLKLENEKLEKDKLQAAEDLKASQIRAAKLTRKLRDLKSKYDEITGKSRSTDSPFDSLDQAIEEERMKQMQGLEKELKDMQTEFNTLKADRDRLQKQVDVLSSANERMVEAKERQDVEVEMWQKRSKDLTTQVQALEWKISELEDGKEESTTELGKIPESSPSVTQPTETLNAVEIDQLLKENHTWNANYENLMQEYQKLRAQCLADSEQRTQIDALVAQQKGMIERLEHEKTYFQDVYDSLKMDYESACAQLASIQTTQSEDVQFVQKAEELEIKLRSAEGQLQESISQLQMVTSDNADLQARCSHLTNERESLVKQLDEGQSRLEITALEMCRLQDNIRVLEEKSAPVQPEPVHEVFVTQEASAQSSVPGSSVFTWGSVVSGVGGDQPAGDIFDSIASSTAQGLEEQLAMKDSEMQKDKRMIETLKRTMAESEQEWNQIIEYHKSQLESAKQTISDLQSEVESLKQFASGTVEVVNREDDYNEQREKYQEMQTLVFTKEKELENLQINLAFSEETKRKLEAELQSKKAEVDRLLNEIPQNSREIAPQSVQASSPDLQVASGYGSGTLPISSMSIPPVSSVNKNLSNELDLALYMLHERDVRCEELTLELTQLLEERDGLQLRLSNAIRTNEELRERLKQLLTTQSTQSADVNNSSILLQGQFPVVSSIPMESSQNVASEGYTVDLQNKLTELRKMGYNHDKSLKEDSEYRHQQQMRLLSPSPTTVMSASTAELTVTSETALEPASETIPIVPDPDPNNVDQSSCIVM